VARLPSAIDITFRPSRAWQALRAADPSSIESVLRHALPFSLLPALAWPLGQAGSGALPLVPAALAASLLSTVLLTLASILVLAAAFYFCARSTASPCAISARSASSAAASRRPRFGRLVQCNRIDLICEIVRLV
jgi:hypothetical protein